VGKAKENQQEVIARQRSVSSFLLAKQLTLRCLYSKGESTWND